MMLMEPNGSRAIELQKRDPLAKEVQEDAG
jgi:hypothetical protein